MRYGWLQSGGYKTERLTSCKRKASKREGWRSEIFHYVLRIFTTFEKSLLSCQRCLKKNLRVPARKRTKKENVYMLLLYATRNRKTCNFGRTKKTQSYYLYDQADTRN